MAPLVGLVAVIWWVVLMASAPVASGRRWDSVIGQWEHESTPAMADVIQETVRRALEPRRREGSDATA